MQFCQLKAKKKVWAKQYTLKENLVNWKEVKLKSNSVGLKEGKNKRNQLSRMKKRALLRI